MDATTTTPATQPNRRPPGWGPLGVLIGTYLLVYGLPIRRAVEYPTVGQTDQVGALAYAGALLMHAATILAATVIIHRWLAVSQLRWRDLGLRAPRKSPATGRTSGARGLAGLTVVYLGGVVASSVAMMSIAALSGAQLTDPRGPWGAPKLIVAVALVPVMAAWGEEVIVVALTVVVLERYRLSAGWILTVAVAARLAYHVYYGIAVLGLVIWAVIAVELFRRTRSIVAPLIAHYFWNVAAIIAVGQPAVAAWLVVVFIVVTVTVAAHRPDGTGTCGLPGKANLLQPRRCRRPPIHARHPEGRRRWTAKRSDS